MNRPAPSAPTHSQPWPTSPPTATAPLPVIRDRDYLLDRHGVIFKVVGDVHPDSHYLGYVKYHPAPAGDRHLFGQTYRQNSVVSKSFGILADRPECYIYSPVLGCVITGLPRQDIITHYSCRQSLAAIHHNPGQVAATPAGHDLLAIIDYLMDQDCAHLFGITGSFLVGCVNTHSDIDLVCYGTTGYNAAADLFNRADLVTPYAADNLTRLYLRRAKYMSGIGFNTVMTQEQRKFQGLTPHADAHINCEPLRTDHDDTFIRMTAKEIGEMSLLATITDHNQGLATPALYQIEVDTILHSTVDEPDTFAPRITLMRSYLGAYTGAFRTGDTVHLTGKLVHIRNGDTATFGIELTPWSVSRSYLAQLAR